MRTSRAHTAQGRIPAFQTRRAREYVLGGVTTAVVLALISLVVACGDEEQAVQETPVIAPGNMIAFEDGGGIAAINVDGSGFVRISDAQSSVSTEYPFAETFYDHSPAWSPAGDRLAYLSGRDGDLEVYVANADGSDERNLTLSPEDDGGGGFAWAPDGNRIAFASGAGLWVINADGSGPTNITEDYEESLAGLSWSPDGRRIAFAAANGGINVVNADGSSLVTISQPGTVPLQNADGNVIRVSLDRAPSWSPDGEKIAYLAAAGELHVMGADGTGDMWITGGSAPGTEVSYLAWSPEGRRIAFVQIHGHISVVNGDGSCLTQLTSEDAEHWSASPTWSPDGKRIAFASNRGGTGDIYIMNDDGSAQRQVTKFSPGSGATSVTWSPDPTRRADREIDCAGRSSPVAGTATAPATPMSAPTLLAPAGNATVVQNDMGTGCPPDPANGYGYRILFDWSDSVGGTELKGYRFVIQSPGESRPSYETSSQDSQLVYVRCNEYVPDDRLDGWHWWVIADGQAGNSSDWSAQGDFRFEPCLMNGVPCGGSP